MLLEMQKELDEYSVKELKAFLDERGVATSGILEKSELLTLAKDNKTKKPPLHIEVVSDTICPWCFVGKRHLDTALKAFPHLDVQVEWKPFFLNPHIPEGGVPVLQYLEQKYGKSRDFTAVAQHLRETGAKAGITFMDSSQRRVYPTMRSHRLVELARRKGGLQLQGQVVEDLFHRYFELGSDISDTALLSEVARDNGIDQEEARKFLASDEDVDAVKKLDDEAKSRYINGVPFFTISRPGLRKKLTLSGGQPVEAFVEVIEELGFSKADVPA